MLRIEKILSPNKDGFCEQQNNNTVGFRVLALWGPSLSPVLFSKELCDSCKSESHGKSDSRKATTCGKSEFPSLWRSHQSNLALASLWLCIKCVLEKQHNLVFLQRRTVSSRLKNSANINPAQQIWQIPLPHGAWSSLTVLIVSCLSLFSCYLYELPQWIIFLHLTPLVICIFPNGYSILNMLCPGYPLSLLCTCPNHLKSMTAFIIQLVLTTSPTRLAEMQPWCFIHGCRLSLLHLSPDLLHAYRR